jgi:pyruvate kinase
MGAKRILSVSQSGSSCLKMSRFRPRISVVGVSNALSVVRRMCLYWGISPFYLKEYDEDDSQLESHVIERVKKACELASGDRIVITRGTGAFFARGSSNSIRVLTIET